jgi:uncharacterized protein
MTFDEVLKELSLLSGTIKESGFRPDFLVGLARGGWIPTRLLSTLLEVREILSVGMKYEDPGRTKLTSYSMPYPMPHGKKLLLIEDCLESGKSMAVARDLLIEAGNEVRTAALFVTDRTEHMPDFYRAKLSHAPEFPWE